MADITGRIYEAFTEFVLRKVGYRDEWTQGLGRQYLYEKHVDALCYRSPNICEHAEQCMLLSKSRNLPYGPWYDADFTVVDNSIPVASLFVTHWGSPSDSSRKFWRTVEDHFQYKTLYGSTFLSINLVFTGLNENSIPLSLNDSIKLVPLHGWKPAVSSLLVASFDQSICFPVNYAPLNAFTSMLPQKLPSGTRKRRDAYNNLWQQPYERDGTIQHEIDYVVELVSKALAQMPSKRMSLDAINHLQHICFEGRQRAINLTPTNSRYRKGIQHTFIVHETIARHFDKQVHPNITSMSILTSSPRFQTSKLPQLLNLAPTVDNQKVEQFCAILATIPIQLSHKLPIYLLHKAAGVDHVMWNADFAQFITGLRSITPTNLDEFFGTLGKLFDEYRLATGVTDVLDDLYSIERVRSKIRYVNSVLLPNKSKEEFIKIFSDEFLVPGRIPPHQQFLKDKYNWVIEVLLAGFDLGRKQHIVSQLPIRFEKRFSHSLRLYAFQGNFDQLVNHLILGLPVEQYFSKTSRMSKSEFYEAIIPLFAECLWDEIKIKAPLDENNAALSYRHRKAMRIISQSDLEPISTLLQKSKLDLRPGRKLTGAFNQLSNARGWGRTAMITETAGVHSKSGAVIQTQSVFGEKHIADKTKEICGRMRAVHLKCNSECNFVAEPSPGVHYLVVDGDWPIQSKLNLLEAGFSGVFEIAELEKLAEELGQVSSLRE